MKVSALRLAVAAVATVAVSGTPLVSNPATAAEVQAGAGQEFVVVYRDGVSVEEARRAVAAAGGRVVRENADVGVAMVVSLDAGFAGAAHEQAAIEGIAANRVIGAVPRAGDRRARKAEVAEGAGPRGAAKGRPPRGHDRRPRPPRAEPLADQQWDMQQIGATPEGSYRYEQGRGVKVGVIDTGVDGSHPDIAANLDRKLSRNFTVDIPTDANGDPLDGPCEEDPDGSCNDPADVDEYGHGTHVASIIASPINGLGVAGVAPQATIVNLRAALDSGYFLVQASVDALTYAGRHGIDVVNMSYYVDPWLFNCTAHPADSAEEQAEQRTIITAMQRALDYAHDRHVTLVASAGNGNSDYTKVLSDASSPDVANQPGRAPKVRDLLDPAACTSMPSEGNHVITVSATAPSQRKSYFSDYGLGHADLSAPGGDIYDTPTGDRDFGRGVLAAYPRSLIPDTDIDANGEPTVANLVRDCDDAGVCGYYEFLQGTSMASPHAAGVATVVVGRWGSRDRRGEIAMDPDRVERIMRTTATDVPCPDPPTVTYTRRVPQPDGTIAVRTSSATCEGPATANGFYGDGLVSALRAAGGRPDR